MSNDFIASDQHASPVVISPESLHPSDRLVMAAASGSVDRVTRLLDSGVGVDTVGDSGRLLGRCTPLAAAVYNGNVRVVELLLVRGADPDQKLGDTTMLEFSRRQLGTTSILLKHGADCGRNSGAIEVLINAAIADRSELVRNLLQRGVDPDQPNRRGTTPLIQAAANGSDASISILLDHGADLDARDADGLTASAVVAQAFKKSLENRASRERLLALQGTGRRLGLTLDIPERGCCGRRGCHSKSCNHEPLLYHQRTCPVCR